MAGARQDYEDLAYEIDNLREQRLNAMTEKAEREGLKMRINKMQEGKPNIVDAIINGKIQLIINTPATGDEKAFDDSYIRKNAIKAKIPYMTTMAAAKATADGIYTVIHEGEIGVKSLQEIHELI